MNKMVIPAMVLLIVLFAAGNLVLPLQNEKPIVVATTTVLGSIVHDLAKDDVIVIVIASPNICPAHYDIKPSDIAAVSMAKLILYHGIEPWLNRLVEASGSKATLVKISGPWNTPENLKSYYERVAEALNSYLGVNVSERLNICLKRIDEVASKMKEIATEYKFNQIKVVCMKWQASFVSWLGFQVVAIYDPPERLSSKDIVELEAKAKEEGAMLIIDNLQSGVAFGKSLAEKVGAVHVALTNFPGTAMELNNVTMIFLYNIERLKAAVSDYRILKELSVLQNQLETYRLTTYSLIAIAIFEAILLVLALKRRK